MAIKNENNPKVRMVFLRDQKRDKDEPTQVFAYFPDEKWNYTENTCYAHIGQHGACDPAYATECEPATQDEYRDLLRELTDIVGYNVEVVNADKWLASQRVAA